MTKPFTAVAVSALFLFTSAVFAHEEPHKPTAKPSATTHKDINVSTDATPKKQSVPSPKEKALATQLEQLQKRRDALIKKSMQLDKKRLATQDVAERKRLDQEKVNLVKELDTVEKKRMQTYRAWQIVAMERWRRDNPEAFQTPPSMPQGMIAPPQVIAKQIEIAKEQLAKLKKEGKPDTDPQVKMYRERVDRYTQMMKATAAKSPTAPKPATPQK